MKSLKESILDQDFDVNSVPELKSKEENELFKILDSEKWIKQSSKLYKEGLACSWSPFMYTKIKDLLLSNSSRFSTHNKFVKVYIKDEGAAPGMHLVILVGNGMYDHIYITNYVSGVVMTYYDNWRNSGSNERVSPVYIAPELFKLLRWFYKTGMN